MSKKILVIDDSEVEGLYIQGIGAKLPEIEMEVVKSYEEGLSCAQNKAYSLMLVDEVVPKGDCVELLKKIKETGTNADTPAILMGDAADFSSEDFLKKTGYTNYVDKPVEFSMLKALISMYT